jgi:hypothetical protein
VDEHQGVNGLELPAQLLELLSTGRWEHPGDQVLRDLMPWFESPLDFLTSIDWMRRESRSLTQFADDPSLAQLFRETRGSNAIGPVNLPWIDVEQAVLIAVNRLPGDDVAMALDYRTDPANPRVVASDFWTNPRQCSWRVVTPTFSQLVQKLGLRPA